ncbi:hypothetical protein, partial [Burkholderia vietnamiensis]|uniref:hypothetical protein n=1 Tax=Burkholderia vietnamiensis TaxID=60552 RepID=UPI0030B83F99
MCDAIRDETKKREACDPGGRESHAKAGRYLRRSARVAGDSRKDFLHSADGTRQMANGKRQTANGKRQTANGKRQTANGKRQT